MNTLSWLILLAGVTGSLGKFIAFVTVVFGFLTIASVFVLIASLDSRSPDAPQITKRSWRWFGVFLSLMIFTGALAAITPSRQTVLLIAASQMGEQVLNHPRVNQVVDPGIELLTTWMQKETVDLRNQMQSSGNSNRR